MKSYVLLISLGPVQEFIASARRCQDLWFGSWLLSELARAAALAIESHPAGRDSLVFPGGLARKALDPSSRVEVANKIVALVEGTPDTVRDVAGAARRATEARRDELTEEAFSRAKRRDPQHKENFHETEALAQVRDLIELQWVAAPVGDGGYGAARHEAERLLAARKNTRSWPQPAAWARSGVPKSSLDGARESVLDEKIYPRPGAKPSLSEEARRRAYGVSGRERLCGVGLVKRLGRRPEDEQREGERAPRFFSTSHLAALPWMLGVQKLSAQDEAKVGRAWADYCASLDTISEDILAAAETLPHVDARLFGRIDGQVLFEGRLLETLDECGIHDRDAQRKATRSLRAFQKTLERNEPQPYYAILLADGDRMGRVLDRQDSVDAHRAISAALVAFAGRAREIVRRHHGSLVYSGGDDVLALLPLHRAVACAAALAEDFRGALQRWPDASGQPATLSAGLAVVHHLTPLDVALDVARRAEKRAKGLTTKDALAIVVDKRGGDETEVRGRWNPLVKDLQVLTWLHQKDAIPDKAGHELAALERLTAGVGRDERSVFEAIARSEALRILERKRAERGQQKIEGEVLARLKGMVREVEEDAAAKLGALLVVSAQLARAANEAGDVPPETLEEVLG